MNNTLESISKRDVLGKFIDIVREIAKNKENKDTPQEDRESENATLKSCLGIHLGFDEHDIRSMFEYVQEDRGIDLSQGKYNQNTNFYTVTLGDVAKEVRKMYIAKRNAYTE